ncbi:MAG: type VI secretion system tube protein Hcp [Lentisphaerae bacterium]|nr:type VI secretion system tube protein Hcp [Lentisphaerota bacterium]
MKQLLRHPAIKIGTWVMVGALFLLPLILVDGRAAAFMKFDGVDGEALDSKHEGWIDVESFSYKMERLVSGEGTTRTNGASHVSDLVVRKWLDKSSPKLILSLCDGKVFPKVEIDVVESIAGTSNDKQLTYRLHDVLVTSAGPTGSTSGSEAQPTELVSLNFTKIEMQYSNIDRATGQTNYTTNVMCVVEDEAP